MPISDPGPDPPPNNPRGSANPPEAGGTNAAPLLLGVVDFSHRFWKRTLAWALAAVGLTVAYLLVSPPVYQVRSTFLPETDAAASQLSGLAAQFGINVGGASRGPSLELFAELVESREVLRQTVTATYSTDIEGIPRTESLLDLLDVSGDTEADRVREGIETLDEQVFVNVDLNAGLVSVTTRAPSEDLTEQINRRLLDRVNELNLRNRRQRASEERSFLEARLDSATNELFSAEDRLQEFLFQNRAFESSPQLTLEYGRLQRTVSLREQVVATLTQAYEQARIEENRTTPVVTVVEAPEGAAEPGKRMVRTALLAGAFGGLAALVFGLFTVWVERIRAVRPDEYAHLASRVPLLNRVGS